MILEVSRLAVDYGSRQSRLRAVRDVSFSVEEGELFTLLGPSGCGKSTTLRAIAGLEQPSDGSIRLAGRELFAGRGTRPVPVNRRDISMVFQSYAIWPHMTVAQNVAFPAEAAGLSRAEAKRRAGEALALVGLVPYADRPATDISGGQQQRVALARAIVKGATLMLLDEPLSNLDAKLREEMRQELRDLQKRLGTTALYVTHDQEEALSMSDRVALMRDGHIVELGTPDALYRRPRHPFTAQFLGQTTLVACRGGRREGNALRAESALGPLRGMTGPDEPGEIAWAMVRPEHVEVLRQRDEASLPATVAAARFAGRLMEHEFAPAAGRLKAIEVAGGPGLQPGDEVGLRLPPCHLVFLPADRQQEIER